MGRQARIGVIGCGWWATFSHIPAVLDNKDATLAAVADPRADRLTTVRERFGVSRTFQDFRQMLDEAPLDGVIVASPHVAHFENAFAAVSQGKPVLVEKPMTASADDARRLVAESNKNGVQIAIPCGWNFKPYTTAACDLVGGGAIGRVEHVICHMASALDDLFAGEPMLETADHLFRPPPSTWADPARAGGYGWGQMSHSLAWLYRVTDLKPHSVFAMAGESPAGVDYHDAAAVRFENGATGSLSGSSTVPKHCRVQLDIRIFGTEGMLLFDAERERLEVRRRDGNDTVVEIAPGDGAYESHAPVHRFVDICLGRRDENEASGEVGLRVVETLDALYRSAASGRAEAV